MVKFFNNSYSYDYSLPTVSLAYFIRYPNPFATHVISTDVIERTVDEETGRLYTTRLVKKQSRLPPVVMNLLPKNILGNGSRGPNGEAQNLILEKSVVDLREGWMETETQNLQYRGVLSVIERQRYDRPRSVRQTLSLASGSLAETSGSAQRFGLVQASQDVNTEVTTNVTFKSRFGLRKKDEAADGEERRGFLTSWSTSALQRTIESTSLNRTMNGLAKSREGMNIVLQRIREGGLVGALEGMRQDREQVVPGSSSK